MYRTSIVLLALATLASQVAAQSSPATNEITFRLSSAKPSVDTGLDLHSGDLVKIKASPASPASSACNPAGLSPASAATDALPLPAAPSGALIARLHGQGSTPVLIGSERELKIEEASHLLLGMNLSGKPSCDGEMVVTVQKTAAGSAAKESAQQVSRGQQLKTQLGTAAQVFMQGQFGLGKNESGSSTAVTPGSSATTKSTEPTTVLKTSDAPLDGELRKKIDGLPRRVNDQFNNLGDMVNFVIVGSQKDVQAALDAATWHVADTSNTMAAINAAVQTYGSKDYLAMPMSTLFLFGRKQDFGYEMAEPIAMVASRHHFRIWKAPFTWKDHEVWVGAGTHDIGFAKDRRNNNVTHKIDPAVDGERDNIGISLQKTKLAKSMSYYLPPNPVQEAKNATGDGYHSDGRLLVVLLQ
ncbi:MAG TPA: LssY C-terminal domain-containing protein [Candidatus Sulfotelmatobacter sp.]